MEKNITVCQGNSMQHLFIVGHVNIERAHFIQILNFITTLLILLVIYDEVVSINV